ncbi:glycine zipper 2TM domain-containing protein [Sphingomicrobium nitratireducens]|uniref:glycine zipper 2TM domain-containing protein n=1 Tax=Sphingomicrobium nitratireducens TaxID=2964666 RepID=UPI00223F6A1E|nr:glycine zipper 2TM domain-containing protein [Sphingomicrobium nitratireducens]
MRPLLTSLTALALVSTSFSAPAFAHKRHGYQGPVWTDSQGRYRCKRPNGTTGLIVGAATGALVGRAVDTHGERATGTIIGAAAGALLGREIDRNRKGWRCR